jgi:uncharacterized protein YfaS (alpha-2-macroglobulin family)
VSGKWPSRFASAKARSAELLESGKMLFRGKYPIRKKATAAFSRVKDGVSSGGYKARMLRTMAQSPAFGICLAIFGAYALTFAVIVPAARSAQAKSRGFSIEGPSAPDPDEPNKAMRVIVRFEGSAAPLDMIDRPVESGIKISPSMAGAWKWESDRILAFTPAEKWPAGAEYVVSFAKSVMAPSVRLRAATGSFATPAVDCFFGENEFYIHPDDPSVRFLSATIRSNYAVTAESVKEALRVRYRGKNLPFTLRSDETQTEFYLQSGSVDLPEETGAATVVLEGLIESPTFSSKRRLSKNVEIKVPSEKEYASVAGVEVEYLLDESSRYGHALIVNTKGRTTVKDIAAVTEAWILPKDMPAAPGREAQEDFAWRSPDQVGPDVLKLAKRIDLEAQPSETASAQTAAFSFPATPSAYVYVRIRSGLSFNGGYRMKADFAAIKRTKPVPVTARFFQEGVLMSSRGGKSLTVISYGMDKIGFRVHRVIPDQVNDLITQSHGDLAAMSFYEYQDFNETNVSKIFEREFQLADAQPGEPSYTTLDLSRYMEADLDPRMRYGLFLVDAYRVDEEGQSKIARRLVMVSDLGFLVKRSMDGSRDVFVMEVKSGLPAAGASVSVVGRNGLEVVKATTDGEGHARIPDLSGLKREKEPVAFVVRDAADMTFLPFDSDGRFLDYSNFDIGGEREAAARTTLSAFVFSDRGLYRPGETARLGIFVKQKDWKEPVSGVKLVLRVSDPRGAVVLEKAVEPSGLGLVEAEFQTRVYSPTGEYRAGLYVDKEKEEPIPVGGASFKVEEFLPDRLKISAAISPRRERGWIKPEGAVASVRLGNLFGGPSQGNPLKASIELSPAEPAFSAFGDYSFQVTGEQPSLYRLDLPPAATDESGAAAFELPLGEYTSPLYRLSFYCQGFEKEGGRGVSATADALVSPLDFIVGFKADGSLDYVNRGAERNVSLVAVGPTLERVSASGLSLSVLKREWVSTLTKQDNGLYKYRSIEKKSEVSRAALAISREGASFVLGTEQPGDYEFVIEKDGAPILTRGYSVLGQGNMARSLDQHAELAVKLDKADYAAGESVNVSINAPYAGSGLITIERDRVYAYKWFRADSTSSIQSIVLPDGIRGNAYVNVSFIRASDSREVYMSPLCYGVASLSVDRGRLDDALTLESPERTRPGQTISIRYASRHPGKMILYGVDEGILQVAKYKLPDPLGYFLRKRALEVSTCQILDLILPNFLDDRSSAPGGGEDIESLARNLNPFKRKGQPPVAFWSGVIDCGPAGGTYEYRVPDYFNGTLRIIAVSTGQDSLGSVQRQTAVRDDLIITPQLPNFVSTGDSFVIPVTVSNNVPGSGKDASVRVAASCSAGIALKVSQSSVKAGENGEGTVYFEAVAGDVPGNPSLVITATYGTASSRYSADISVRPPTAYRAEVKTGRVANGTKKIAANEREYYPEYRKLSLSASYLPLGLSKGLLAYLESYPYGCSEQILSQAFPKVALYAMDGFEEFTFAKVSGAVDAACDILLSRQNPDGSIGLWTMSGEGDPYVSAYAAHFLTEAREKGFSVPQRLMGRLVAYLQEYAREAPDGWQAASSKAYAAYVLTRNQKVVTEEINSIRDWLRKNASDWGNRPAGLFLAASYALLKLDAESKTILDSLKAAKDKETIVTWVDFPENSVALKAYLHARHFPRSRPDALAAYPERLASLLEEGRLSSFSASMAVLALAECSKIATRPDSARFVAAQTVDRRSSPLPLEGKVFMSAPFSHEAESLTLENPAVAPVYYQVTSAGFESVSPAVAENHGLEVFHEMLDSGGAKTASTKLGDEVTMRTRYRSLGDAAVTDLVIVDMLPGGFDPDVDSIREAGSRNGVEYVDIREDRVVFFLSAARKESAEISYKLKSVSRGKFSLGPSYAASMYDSSVWSMNAAASVTVK